MQQTRPANNTMRIDLSSKSPEEIADFLHILLSARYTLHQKGLSLQIERRFENPVHLNKSSSAC